MFAYALKDHLIRIKILKNMNQTYFIFQSFNKN